MQSKTAQFGHIGQTSNNCLGDVNTLIIIVIIVIIVIIIVIVPIATSTIITTTISIAVAPNTTTTIILTQGQIQSFWWNPNEQFKGFQIGKVL